MKIIKQIKNLGKLSVLTAFSMNVYSQVEFEIPFQQGLADKPFSSISIELGGYDITHFSQVLDNRAEVSLDTDLEPGQYHATVLVFYQDGEIQALADQVITIQGSARSDWSVNSTLNTSYRSDEKDAEDFAEQKHWHTNGGLTAESSVVTGNWTISSSAQTLYDSNSLNNPSGNEWELPNYQVGLSNQGEYGSMGLYAGDTYIERENMLFSNYQRRGISVKGQSADDAMNGSVFTVVSDITTAYDENLLTPEDSSEETVGGVFNFSPIPSAREQLSLGVGYVNGKGTTTGSGFTVTDPDTVYGGSSWNTTLDSLWFSRSLWFHAEYAESDFDSDGIGVGEDEESDDANKLLVQFNSDGDFYNFGLDRWDLSLQRQEVGSDFYSIANLALPGDLESRRLNFNGSKGGFSFTSELAKEENNVEGDDTRAHLTVEYRAVDVYYTPFVSLDSGFWSVVGMPSLNAYWHETDNYQKDEDAAVTSYDLDREGVERSLGVQFSHNTWSWGLSYTLTEDEDNSESVFQNGVEVYTPGSDSDNTLTVLNFSWYPSSRVMISPLFQWTNLEETDFNNEYKSFNGGIDTQFQIVPDKLLFNLNYSLNTNDNRFEDPLFTDSKFNNETANFQLLWKALQAKNNRPGSDVYLNGSYGKQEDEVGGDVIENWQVLVGFSLYWDAASNR